MIRNDLQVIVERQKSSHSFKHDLSLNDFPNNLKNNCRDTIILSYGNRELFYYEKLQSVSNHPYYSYFDTIRKGSFMLECFIDPGSYQEEIHGISQAYDIENQLIDRYCMQNDRGRRKGRWLMHSSLWNGKVYENCWSAGCLMVQLPTELIDLNNALRSVGVKKGDQIPGQLIEV